MDTRTPDVRERQQVLLELGQFRLQGTQALRLSGGGVCTRDQKQSQPPRTETEVLLDSLRAGPGESGVGLSSGVLGPSWDLLGCQGSVSAVLITAVSSCSLCR